MIRNLKLLGLAVVSVLAMSAMLASAASAEGLKGFLTGGDTTGSHENVTLIGEQYDNESETWNYFQANGDKLRCDEALFTGTLRKGGTSHDPGVSNTDLSFTPHYKGCYSEGQGVSVTVTHNECVFTFTQMTTAADTPEGSYTSKVGLTCPHENAIVIHAYAFGNSTSGSHFFNVCTITVAPKGAVTEGEGETPHRFQEYKGHAILTPIDNHPEGWDDVTAKITIEEDITSHSNCPGAEPENDEKGSYKQTVTLRAFGDEDPEPHTQQRDLWISEEE